MAKGHHNNNLTGFQPDIIRRESRVCEQSILVIAIASLLFSTPILAADQISDKPPTIDALGFSSAMGNSQFRSSVSISSNQRVSNANGLSMSSPSAGLKIESTIEFDALSSTINRNVTGTLPGEDSSSSDGNFRVQRFSTSISGSKGILTVGKDWSNFQDFLGRPDSPLRNFSANHSQPLISDQLRWQVDNGLSVSLENDIRLHSGSSLVDGETESSQSLILAWNSAENSGDGQYSVATMGRKFDGDNPDNINPDSSVGWGLKLVGGWQFGDLFAALSVTLGNRIDSLLLGDNIKSGAGPAATLTSSASQSVNINPSLNYQLGENADLHLAFNRFESGDQQAPHGVDTLDTIHLGYTWSSGPGTRFGIEFVGKDVEGATDMSNSNAVNFAVNKEF
jgi:hypothetical protein